MLVAAPADEAAQMYVHWQAIYSQARSSVPPKNPSKNLLFKS